MAINKLGTSFLNSLFSKTKTVASKVNELVDFANNGVISALTATGVITFNNAIVRKGASSAINATATATAPQIAGGIITANTAITNTITLPTATLLGVALGAVRGTVFEFTVDNSTSAGSTVLAVGTGITAASAITGGTNLTMAPGAVGTFKVVFYSTTAAVIARTI
jgi:hypothetical protein